MNATFGTNYTTQPFWITHRASRIPRNEEVRMFHRLQFWRRMSLVLGFIIAALFAGLIGFEKAVIESTQPQLNLKFDPNPQVEIMREPAAKKIDNLTHA